MRVGRHAAITHLGRLVADHPPPQGRCVMTLAIVTGWDAAPAILLLSLSIPYLILGYRKEGKR